jgi:hypothetical protein
MPVFNKMLKITIKNKRFRHKTALAFITIALLSFSGCGKRKLPLPPVERIAQRVEIKGLQQGDRVTIQWKMPARNASEGNTLNISRVDVYRLIEPLDSPLSLSEEEFSSRSTLIASVPVTENDFGLKELNYSDRLEFSGQPARLRYAIRFVNASGQKAAFSNFLLIEPTAKIAESPKNVRAEVFQDRIEIKWTAPTQNVDGSTPPNILGYNVYRITAENGQSPKPLNTSPVTDTSYADAFFDFGKNYRYFVRTVSLGTESQPVESLESEAAAILPVDTFPPAPPSAITVAASPGTISIFFAVNLEKDVAGYRIYRSTDRNLPKNEWRQITPDLLKTNTFQDSTVEAGTQYFYFLTAVDTAGNVSQPSEIVSERAF